MKRDVINLIIGIVIILAAIVASAYFLAKFHNKRMEEEESDIRMVIDKYQHRIDSLKSVIDVLEQSFEADSVEHALEDIKSQKAIKSLQKRLYETSFKHYNNDDLDSVIRVLWPNAKLYSSTGNGTVSH